VNWLVCARYKQKAEIVLWTIACETGGEAIAKAKRNLCLRGIERHFSFQAFKVSLLELERSTAIPEQQKPDQALAVGNGSR